MIGYIGYQCLFQRFDFKQPVAVRQSWQHGAGDHDPGCQSQKLQLRCKQLCCKQQKLHMQLGPASTGGCHP